MREFKDMFSNRRSSPSPVIIKRTRTPVLESKRKIMESDRQFTCYSPVSEFNMSQSSSFRSTDMSYSQHSNSNTTILPIKKRESDKILRFNIPEPQFTRQSVPSTLKIEEQPNSKFHLSNFSKYKKPWTNLFKIQNLKIIDFKSRRARINTNQLQKLTSLLNKAADVCLSISLLERPKMDMSKPLLSLRSHIRDSISMKSRVEKLHSELDRTKLLLKRANEDHRFQSELIDKYQLKNTQYQEEIGRLLNKLENRSQSSMRPPNIDFSLYRIESTDIFSRPKNTMNVDLAIPGLKEAMLEDHEKAAISNNELVSTKPFTFTTFSFKRNINHQSLSQKVDSQPTINNSFVSLPSDSEAQSPPYDHEDNKRELEQQLSDIHKESLIFKNSDLHNIDPLELKNQLAEQLEFGQKISMQNIELIERCQRVEEKYRKLKLAALKLKERRKEMNEESLIVEKMLKKELIKYSIKLEDRLSIREIIGLIIERLRQDIRELEIDRETLEDKLLSKKRMVIDLKQRNKELLKQINKI